MQTPLCGTCKLAEQFVQIVEQTMDNEMIWLNVDIHFVPQFVQTYQIESVPCLLVFYEGELRLKTYRFSSVSDIYDQLQEVIMA